MKQDQGLLLLRVGLSIVFAWQGIEKIINPLFSIGWIPDWLKSVLLIKATTFIFVLSGVEIIIAMMVLIGLYTRVGAVLSSTVLLLVIGSWGLNEIMIRDAGLLFLALGIAVLGPGKWSVDALLAKRRKFIT